MRTYGLPQKYTPRIEEALRPLGYSLGQPKKLAEAVLRLSDHYQLENSISPWSDSWAQAAYLCYFFPLNYARVTSVVVEGEKRSFFNRLSNLIDFGSGTLAATLAVNDHLKHSWLKQLCYEPSQKAHSLSEFLVASDYKLQSTNLEVQELGPQTLSIFSYTLNELEKFPKQFLSSEALLLVEPSTRRHGRRLLELRDDLITNHGYFAWAPCPHQGPCPLLNDSERDWCHDRIAFEAPDWFKDLESHLPIKNPTLTFSYVLLRKTAPLTKVSDQIVARIVGDALAEKGKTRQLICLDSQRRFLSWFPQRLDRATLAQLEFNRGDLVTLQNELEERSNEIRVKAPHQIAKLI